jgi:hypothetical protein
MSDVVNITRGPNRRYSGAALVFLMFLERLLSMVCFHYGFINFQIGMKTHCYMCLMGSLVEKAGITQKGPLSHQIKGNKCRPHKVPDRRPMKNEM